MQIIKCINKIDYYHYLNNALEDHPYEGCACSF